ncbi:Uncharacterised protein [Mycobacteroides abscessus]|uniref:Uncharacterized protein n=3 Tax=Mycobacteroides abscessus TaxID=36809 RepID=A0A829HVB2_9MYCO|nr:hypothetical protein [Mycobacteroides abscessus]ESV59283.1 hypothetical protein L830_1497 [Mycobacteroides abscessus MAB_082312_2258]ESV64095.1 hypothetical protein L833_1479 [Mycobacteroides abscessus MAB_091912_2446]AIC71945.1 hypothetical protein MYCMA_07765 [Mycobacteroides abscessus subsp. massiliense str. GO 06]AMU26736.1 hypothetical protein A3N96_16235 [Mycobacteroides abscessus]AMU36418.1 hypothetical protein A3N98_15425 [Mycobacteroides abscessus]
MTTLDEFMAINPNAYMAVVDTWRPQTTQFKEAFDDIKKHFVQFCPECTKHSQQWCQHVGPGFSVEELKITECTITPEPPKPSSTAQASSGDNEYAQAMDLVLKLTGLSMQALNAG